MSPVIISGPSRFTRLIAAGLTIAILALAGGPAAPAHAASGVLDGSWSGTGSVILANGKTEKARCRARFNRGAGGSYSMSAVCATASARVAQTAAIRVVGKGSYTGSFYNQEYNVQGSISIKAQGNRLGVSLSGGGASAYITLSR